MEANNHPTQEELSGYALGALEPEEALAVEAHVSTCSDCQVLLEEFETITEGMAFALPPKAPPARLRARLAESIAAGKPVAVVEKKRIHFPVLQIGLALAALAAIILLIVDISLASQVALLQRENTTLIKSIQQSQNDTAILFEPGTTTVPLATGEIRGNLVISADGKKATLFVEGLTPLDAQHTYQAWLIPAQNAPVSAGLFQAASDQPLVTFSMNSTTPIKTYAAFGVTVEPKRGSTAPTTTPILLGKFSG